MKEGSKRSVIAITSATNREIKFVKKNVKKCAKKNIKKKYINVSIYFSHYQEMDKIAVNEVRE